MTNSFVSNEKNIQKMFTIYEDLPAFNTFLFSVWKVHRFDTYVTNKSRPNEPQYLYAFIKTTVGEGRIFTTEGTYTLPANSLALFDVNKIIKYQPVGDDWEYVWYNFSPKKDIPFFKFNYAYDIPPFQEEERLTQEMFDLMNSYTEVNIKLSTLLFTELVYRWINVIINKENKNFPHYQTISDVVSYINMNIEKDFKIHELAQRCYLSERQFRLVFKKLVGLSPKSYICQQKLKKAAIILKTSSMPIASIAYELNYCSPYQFSKEFKEYYGISPKKYRDNIKNYK